MGDAEVTRGTRKERRKKTVRELAMDEFVRKFEDDHKSVQMLDPADRVKHYRFN